MHYLLKFYCAAFFMLCCVSIYGMEGNQEESRAYSFRQKQNQICRASIEQMGQVVEMDVLSLARQERSRKEADEGVKLQIPDNALNYFQNHWNMISHVKNILFEDEKLKVRAQFYLISRMLPELLQINNDFLNVLMTLEHGNYVSPEGKKKLFSLHGRLCLLNSHYEKMHKGLSKNKIFNDLFDQLFDQLVKSANMSADKG